MGPASKGVSPQGPPPSASQPQRCAFRGPPSRIPRRPWPANLLNLGALRGLGESVPGSKEIDAAAV
jgi:hypothetical protein